MEKGSVVFHSGLQARVKLIRLLKFRLPGFWTCEVLDGPQAGQWYDAAPTLLQEVK